MIVSIIRQDGQTVDNLIKFSMGNCDLYTGYRTSIIPAIIERHLSHISESQTWTRQWISVCPRPSTNKTFLI